jgi:hypothetical protein
VPKNDLIFPDSVSTCLDGGWFGRGRKRFGQKVSRTALLLKWLNCKLENWELMVQILEEAGLALLQNVWTNSWAHPAPYSTSTGDVFCTGKAAEAQSWLLQLMLRWKWVELHLCSPMCLHGIHRYNFTFNFTGSKNAVQTLTLTVANKR